MLLIVHFVTASASDEFAPQAIGTEGSAVFRYLPVELLITSP